jgi:transcriptional regulator with XRE-family HTH domain
LSIVVEPLITPVDLFNVTIVDMKFNNWLLDELRKMDWSQAELARHSGLTPQAISNYIQGRIPDDDALKKIAHALKLPDVEVFRAAERISINSTSTRTVEEILHIARQLPEHELADILDLARAKLKRHERTEGNSRTP